MARTGTRQPTPQDAQQQIRTDVPPQLELDRQLCFPLYAASRALIRAYGPHLEPHGLTYPQYLTMLALWESPTGATVGDLGRRLHLDSGTLTPLLKRLQAAGLVDRRRDAVDERRVLVEPTSLGMALRDQVADIPLAVAGSIGLSLQDGATLHRLLHEVLAALDETSPA
jgi:DNA-binding MarR family transcriptional regulator